MSYRTLQVLRWVAFAGLLTFALSRSNSWDWGTYLGAAVWIATIFLPMCAFMGMTVPDILADIRTIRTRGRSREERVPEVVKRVAASLGVTPPRTMKVVPGLHYGAWVDKDTLWITEGLWACSWTSAAEGMFAHEMAHLSGGHSEKKDRATLGLIVLIVVVVALIDNFNWAVWLAVALTIWPLFMPILSRRLEYGADVQGASVVGVEGMSLSLRVLAERPRWNLELDTHPSIQKRLDNLKKLETAVAHRDSGGV